jgi:MutS domain V
MSNIEGIFKPPLFYNKKKMQLSESIVLDLELRETIDPSSNPIYQYFSKPKSVWGKQILQKLPEYYTTDVRYLKDTQKLLKKYQRENKEDIFAPDFNNIIDIWDDVKRDTGFKEKYQYIDWPFWVHLNKSDGFLQAMSIYNLASPVLSLFFPILLLIIPFFVIKFKGVDLTFNEYIEVLKIIASTHAIGKLFTQFGSVKMEEKVYLLVSAGFYLFSIYQNILTCLRFANNMKKIHIYLNDLKQYIAHTEDRAAYFLSLSEKYKTYDSFNQQVRENTATLKAFKDKLQRITPYTTSFSLAKSMQYGYILKCFYELYEDPAYNAAFLYSFGLHGYLDNLAGICENIAGGSLHFAKIEATSSGASGGFKKSFYAPLMKEEHVVTNDVAFHPNMVITGPNASGKTTVLKSTLINVILTQQFGCGFYKEARISPFKYIHCYLNIPDTSGRDSLFQAEARRCKNILDIVQDNCRDTHFCVFDELYSGTNPEEAVESATVFMNYLLKFPGVNAMLTTHFFDLCKSLEKNPRFQNFRMRTEATKDNFVYTYHLERGISEVKGGIKVLKDMNYPAEICSALT